MVVVAGLREVGGFWTRVAAAAAGLYLVIALFSGEHDKIGYIWVNPGGGWEYPAMWAFLLGSILLTDGGRWLAEALVSDRPSLPG